LQFREDRSPDVIKHAAVLTAVKGRCAPLKQWPEDGPSLTAAVRDGWYCAQVGTEGWRRSNERMERKASLLGED
jgi:hypothetical protein